MTKSATQFARTRDWVLVVAIIAQGLTAYLFFAEGKVSADPDFRILLLIDPSPDWSNWILGVAYFLIGISTLLFILAARSAKHEYKVFLKVREGSRQIPIAGADGSENAPLVKVKGTGFILRADVLLNMLDQNLATIRDQKSQTTKSEQKVGKTIAELDQQAATDAQHAEGIDKLSKQIEQLEGADAEHERQLKAHKEVAETVANQVRLQNEVIQRNANRLDELERDSDESGNDPKIAP